MFSRMTGWIDGEFYSHDWPVFHSRIVGQSETTPDNHIILKYIILSSSHIGNTTGLFCTGKREMPCCVQLILLILGDPEVVVGEKTAPGLDAGGICKDFLRRRTNNLITHWLTGYRILLIQVLDFEYTIGLRRGVKTDRARDRRVPHLVQIPVWVCARVHRHWERVCLHQRVAVPINSWIDAHTKDVLVILRKGTGADNVAPRCGLTGVNIDDRHDARSTSFNNDGAGKIEFKLDI